MSKSHRTGSAISKESASDISMLASEVILRIDGDARVYAFQILNNVPLEVSLFRFGAQYNTYKYDFST